MPTYEVAKIADLTPAAYNPRRMLKHEAEALKASLEEYGAVDPAIVNKDGTIIGGHMRISAATELGWDEFPVMRLDLPDEKARLLNLALNRIDGEWDEDKLAEMLWDLNEGDAEIALSGFDDREIGKLLDSVGGEQEEPPPPPDLPDEATTEPGDVWQMGPHRLICGDATDLSVLECLLAGEQPDAMWTDPPYGVDYVGKTEDALTIANDGAEGISGLLDGAWAAADEVLAPGAAIYIAHPPGALSVEFGSAFLRAGWRLHQTLVWIKDSMVLGHADYHYRHEPILFGYKPGSGRRGRGGEGWYGDNSETSVFEVPRPKVSRDHPTMKPVELIEWHLRNSTARDGLVLDPFAGSGSTLIACERLGRRSALVDLDPRYCDVVVRRWEDLTGKEAIRERVEAVA